MKKSLTYFSLVLVCISVFNSCEDEPVQLNEWTQLKHGTNDFIKRESISNYPEILSYAEDLAKPKYRESTRTEDENATFSILEHINAYIFTDSLATTYTIPILKTNQTKFGFSNLVIKYEGDNPVKEFILNYVPTQNYLSNYVDYNQTPFEGTVTYESIINETEGQRSARMSCSTVWVTYCDWSKDFEHGEVHYAGPNCHQSAFMWPGREVVCEDEPGTYTITPNPEGGGGGFIPGVDTDDDDDDPHTTPIPPDICTTATGGIIGIANNDGCIEPPSFADEIIDCINTDTPNDGILLNDEQMAFLDSRPDEDNMELYEILQNGFCSVESQEIVLSIIDNLNADCNTSEEDLQDVFPNTDDDRLQEIADALNDHAQDFGVDTKEKLQHFLAQAGHESANFETFEENLNYRVNRLGINYWNSKFNPHTSYTDPPTTTIDSTKQNPNDYASTTSTVFVDNELFANFVYDDANRGARYRLGNTQVGDGYLFRGRGIFQLTGRTNYTNFNNYYQENIDEDTNLLTNPDLVATDMEVAVISALWFYQENILDEIEIDENTTVREVTEEVNGGTNGLEEREEIFEECEEHIDCL